MDRTVELLSPAGSMDAVKAALTNGADAVYLGAASFGARSAVGFDEDGLACAIRFCHLHGRRVHVTVNTLVRDDEFGALDHTLRMLEKLRVDAVLVQDLGLLSHIRENYPCFELHLSTQMSLHNAAGADFAKLVGADRLVLARECDLDTIRKVASSGVDTEVFVHGALCVCVSGQCYLSSSIGGRSGNRGRCAQPCRLDYTYLGQKGAWLSPRDICTRDDIPDLIEAGAMSLKIEGRLKRPEYVAVVTASYRKAVDDFYAGRFVRADEHERMALKQIFSRGSFMKGYAFGSQDAGVIFQDRSSPDGIRVGTVVSSRRSGEIYLTSVRPEKTIHNGDGLEISGQSIIYSGPELQPGKNALIRTHTACRPDAKVIRQQDEVQLQAARDTYSGKNNLSSLSIPFDADITALSGQELTLRASNEKASVTVRGTRCEEPLTIPLLAEQFQRSVSKTGSTPFVLRDFRCDTNGVYVPAAEINSLRRQALSMLEDEIVRLHEERVPKVKQFFSVRNKEEHLSRKLFVSFSEPALAYELKKAGADELIFTPRDYRPECLREQLSLLPEGSYIALPMVCSDGVLNEIIPLIRQSGLGMALQNIAQIVLMHRGDRILALSGIPVMNKRTAEFLESFGCSLQTLSQELSFDQLSAMDPGPEKLLLCYGRQRLMTLTHCPYRTFKGLSGGHRECRFCDLGHGCRGTFMTDRMGADYPLLPFRTGDGCRIDLMQNKPLHLSGRTDRIRRLRCSLLLSFTDESREQIMALTDYYEKLLHSYPLPEDPAEACEGRYSEGVL